MHLPRPTPRNGAIALSALAVVVIAVVVALLVSGGSSGTSAGLSSPQRPIPKVSLKVAYQHHRTLPYAKRLRLSLKNGTFSAVSVTESTGQSVAGTFNSSRSIWRSTDSFAPLTQLTSTVSYVDLGGRHTTRTWHDATTDSKKHIDALLSPGAGDSVGVGSPVVVTFDQVVPTSMRAAVEKRLAVTTSPYVVGAWHWMSDQEVHWRPPTYWKTGTKVKISSDLQGLSLGHGIWGAQGHHSTRFKVGASHISEADVATDQMRVYDNGRLIRTLPFSAGAPEWPTKDGVHIAIEKSPTVIMDSATVGIPKGSPNYYYEVVNWDVRISDGGAFVHSAPWSVAHQGHTNVSHGCINLSPTNAEWFYKWALRGDIVDVYNSAAPVNTADPGMADWNMSWKKWVAGDAAPTAAAKALRPLLPHQDEPGFAPVHHAKHSKKHHHHHAKKST
ncbi:MAG TPA: Ig-like domain-containing protein [Mycobacteriales bacterium]|jgi:lipoprotein-anchoring transpeptidase ErfK/SrfK|nr:Ig-like domain-containing protein [Mycobacteriales bacterium]